MWRSEKDFGRRKATMKKLIVAAMTMFAMITCDCLVHDAAADGIVRHSKKVRHANIRHVSTCAYSGCLAHRRFRCPDYYPCYSLYGGYGPFGGSVFWGGFTYAG